jgi:2-desacetyl-2-hydroxyethyl bacteriochlorophyllide A dehydrogenase
MKAATILKHHQIEIIECQVPYPKPEEVLIDIRYIGLCGSDLSIYRGTMPLASYPVIPGHEISGVVSEKGNRVPETVCIGDRVTVLPYTNCGKCPACRVGRINTCAYNQTLGVQRNGALTEKLAVNYRKIYTSNVLSLKELVLVEPLSVGYHATNRGHISEADTVLVLGCGTIGIGVVAACKRKRANIIAVDIDDAKLNRARAFGARCTINGLNENIKHVVMDLTGNEGVNAAIEAAGQPQTFQLAIDLAAHAGRVVYIGYTPLPVTYDTKLFVQKELSIMGSRNALNVFPQVMNMIGSRERPFESLITRIYPFEQTARAFEDWVREPEKITKILIEL